MSNSNVNDEKEDEVIRCELFVPGRLCILGEHTDWAAEYRSQNPNIPCGYTLVCATNHGLYAKVTSRTDNTLRFIHTANEGSFSGAVWKLEVEELRVAAKTGGFFSYVAGTAACIVTHSKYITRTSEVNRITNNNIPKGLLIHNYKTTLSMKKGLSSSAAVCVLVARAFNTIYDLQLTQEELMEIAFQGEMLTPSQCGRMDQCVVMGPGTVGLMEFTGEGCNLRQLQLSATTPSGQLNATVVDYSCDSGTPTTSSKSSHLNDSHCVGKGLYFVVVDLNSSKDTVRILGDLNACFPFAANPTQELMHKYIVEMKTITHTAVTAIEHCDLPTLANMMIMSQKYFDLYCQPNSSNALSAPILHTLLDDTKLKTISLAIKGVGSQGDGSAQILCQDEAQQIQVLEYVKNTYDMDGFTLNIPYYTTD